LATLSLAGTQGLSSVLKPDVVIIDEAAKPTEPETWNALANYQPRVKILDGDHQQLKPVVLSP
jgi:superfamily I DNA and/or RNA helicase